MQSYVFPGNIDKDILKIGSRQIPYMRTFEFSNTVKQIEQMLLSMINCDNGRTIIYTASGTGAMDAIVANYVSTKRKALIINGGSFGQRWFELCKYYRCNCFNYVVEFARDIEYDKLEDSIIKEKPDVLLCQHHETSTGQLFNIKKIADLCKKHQISLVVDAISSFLAEPLNMDELEIDICITSSQKGFNIPPGLSIIFFSQNMLNYPFNHKGYYFDFIENFRNLTRGQTPYSPATTLFLQLHERCKQITQMGVATLIDEVKLKSEFFKNLCKESGWLMPAQTPANAITGFFVNRNEDKIFRSLVEEKEIYIMPGSRKGFFRISHMGVQTLQDLQDLRDMIILIETR